MDLEGILLSEISQTEKDKHHVISRVKSKKRKSQASVNGKISFFFMTE